MKAAKPLRLLYVTARAPFGAHETFVMDEIRALIAQGHRVHIVPLRRRGRLVHALSAELFRRTEAKALLSPSVLLGAVAEFLRSPLRALQGLALLMTWRPYVLLMHLAVFPKALWLAGRIRALRIQHVHAHWATAPAALAMVAAHLARVPWSFTAHRYDLLANQVFARKAERAAFVRVTSDDGRRLALEHCRAPASKLLVLHTGFTPRELPPPLPLPHRPFRLLCPARLVPVKGHEVLLNALARLRMPAELWLAGDGELRQALEQRIARSRLTNVKLLGQVPRERLLDLYSGRVVDAVVLSSHHEGVPAALIEAMACGVPVIATAVGGTPELLSGDAGLLVPPGDSRALAEAVERLARDRRFAADLAERGRARVVAEFSSDQVASLLTARFVATLPLPISDARSAAGILKRTSAA